MQPYHPPFQLKDCSRSLWIRLLERLREVVQGAVAHQLADGDVALGAGEAALALREHAAEVEVVPAGHRRRAAVHRGLAATPFGGTGEKALGGGAAETQPLVLLVCFA